MKNINYLKGLNQYIILLMFLMTGQIASAQNRCNPDITPPVAICDAEATIALDINGEATVHARTFDDGSYDNCAKILKYSTTPDVKDSMIVFSSSVSIDTFVRLYITDEAGNQNSCFIMVNLVACKSKTLTCNANLQVSLLKGTTVTITPDMILEGGPYCPNTVYEMWIIDKDGNRQNPVIDENTEVPVEVHIKDTSSGSECWGSIIGIKVVDCGIKTLACGDTVQIILPKGDSLELKADMFLEGGPYCPNDHYDVNLINNKGVTFKNPTITEKTQSPIAYEIVDKSTGNSCWGLLTIKVVDCTQSLACNDNVTVLVPEGGSRTIVPEMILEGGPYCPWRYYEVALMDMNGDEVNTTVDENTPTPLTVTITDTRTGNSCWGEIHIVIVKCDNDLPLLICNNIEVSCTMKIDPSTTGIPIDESIYDLVFHPSIGEYSVKNDSCPEFKLYYTDHVTHFNCTGKYSEVIERTWVVADFTGNMDNCIQLIRIPYDTIPEDLGLHNFDDIDRPALDCRGGWEKTANGAPHPNVTGTPVLSVCGYISSAFDDVVILGSCNVPIKILRKWTVVDWCTDKVVEENQIIKIVGCEEDKSPPVAICESNLVVALDNSGKAVIFATQLDDGSFDDCGIAKISFDKLGQEISKQFTSADIGKQNVAIYVTDYSGNQTSCWTEVEVQDKFIRGEQIIGGRFYDYFLKPIDHKKRIQLTQKIFDKDLNQLTTDFCPNITNLPLDYAICMEDKDPQGPFFFRASWGGPNSRHLDGVSTLDMVYVVKHLLLSGKLNKIQQVAADVNCSDDITATDLIWMRSIILGVRNEFPCVNWKLLEPDTNQITEFSPHRINSFPNYHVDMIPVKIGDVTGDWLLKEDGKVNSRSGKAVDMYIAEQQLVKGNEYEVSINLENPFNFLGLQLALGYNREGVEIKNVESPFVVLDNINHAIYEDQLRLVLISANLDSYLVNGAWLKVRFEAKKDGKLSDMFHEVQDFKSLYVDENLQESPINIHIGASVSTKNYSFENNPVVSPNPFDEMINISLIDEVYEDGQLSLYDIDGSLIHHQTILQKTKNISVNTMDLNISHGGMYYLKILIGDQIYIEKLVSISR